MINQYGRARAESGLDTLGRNLTEPGEIWRRKMRYRQTRTCAWYVMLGHFPAMVCGRACVRIRVLYIGIPAADLSVVRAGRLSTSVVGCAIWGNLYG
jgi:hypothetical protein